MTIAMKTIERARAIIVNPNLTWATIEQENSAWQDLYMPYMATLAFIPALASVVGWSVLGIGSSVQLSPLTGLGLMLSQYVMTLVMVAVWGWIIGMLAPAFGGQASFQRGIQLTVYASTPAMLVGVFSAVPALSLLALLGAVYALYLVYLGLPVLMKCPSQRALPFLAVAAVAGFLGSLVISIATSLAVPTPLPVLQGNKAVGDAGFTMQPSGTTTTVPASSDPSNSNRDATAKPKAPVYAETLQDMAERLEALAAEQEKTKK